MDGSSGFNSFSSLSRSNLGGGVAPAQAADGRPSSHSSNSGSSSSIAGGGSQCTVREQDRFMPIANVIRIMRKVLPAHAKISDDAKETIQECVSEYISFITGEANERCQREQRKTITAEDVLWAMSKLGFDDYVEPLTVYLHRYRELEGDHRGSLRGDPLPLKRAVLHPQPAVQAMADHAAAGALYGMQPPPAYHLPANRQQHHLGGYGSAGDAAGGYYLGVYGHDQGGSSSSQAPPAANFGPYSPYN